MGRTPTPLTIWCDAASLPDWEDLREKGHTVEPIEFSGRASPDLIVSERAHYWAQGMRPYRDAALKRARARRRTVKAREEAAEHAPVR